MFDAPNYRRLGIWATPDYWKTSANNPIWAIIGVKCREMETGQMFIDKKRHLDTFLLIKYMLVQHEWVSVARRGVTISHRLPVILALRKPTHFQLPAHPSSFHPSVYNAWWRLDFRALARDYSLTPLSGSGSPTATRTSSAGQCWLSASAGPCPVVGSAPPLSHRVPPLAISALTRCCNTTRGASRSSCTTTSSSRSRRGSVEVSPGAAPSNYHSSTRSRRVPLRRAWASRRASRRTRTNRDWETWIAICLRTRMSPGSRGARQRR
jgi:hypothetical protein